MNQVRTIMYLHCSRCLEQVPEETSPAEYARLSIGVNECGDLIVWCVRHNELVRHFENASIGEELFGAASSECNCGHQDCEKETTH